MGAIRICSKGRQTSPAFACRVGHRRRDLVWTDLAGEQGEVFAERAFYCWPGRELGHRFARFWPKIRTYGHATGRRTAIAASRNRKRRCDAASLPITFRFSPG
jgi:hypothetical protein